MQRESRVGCSFGRYSRHGGLGLAPPYEAPLIFHPFCLINIRPAQAQQPSLDMSLVNHATLLALGNDLERIYQPMMAGVRN